MAASFRSGILGVGLALLAIQACGGTSASDGNAGAGKASTAGYASNAGADTSGAGTSSHAGSITTGGGAGNSGGTGSGGGLDTAGSAGTVSSGGIAGSAGSAAGGAASHTACKTVDDCVIASVFGNSGCCTRTDCGSAFNRDWVLSEPCASSDMSKDPVPASCSKGCNLCPASHCTEPVGVQCNAGTCETVSMEGPCASDADCVLALDYTTPQGSCCSCTEVVSKAFEAAESCVELVGAAKPANCTLVSGSCATIDCAPCAKEKPVCMMGRCVAG